MCARACVREWVCAWWSLGPSNLDHPASQGSPVGSFGRFPWSIPSFYRRKGSNPDQSAPALSLTSPSEPKPRLVWLFAPCLSPLASRLFSAALRRANEDNGTHPPAASRAGLDDGSAVGKRRLCPILHVAAMPWAFQFYNPACFFLWPWACTVERLGPNG